MGTQYRIQYKAKDSSNLARQVDSILVAINDELSIYIPESTISQFNRAPGDFTAFTVSYPVELPPEQHHFINNYHKAMEVHVATKGFYDPTIGPLVNYWGFGKDKRLESNEHDQKIVDSLMQFVKFRDIRFSGEGNQYQFFKSDQGIQLDFGGLAKGYAVDIIGRFLEARDVVDYLVEIGGELRTRGQNSKGGRWTIGIQYPREEAGLNEFIDTIFLKDAAMATSGNYRNYYKVDGRTFSHTINPKTGMPERNNLLSVTVIANDCGTADAFATGFMAMGFQRAIHIAAQVPNLEGYFVFTKPDGKMYEMYTGGFSKLASQ